MSGPPRRVVSGYGVVELDRDAVRQPLLHRLAANVIPSDASLGMVRRTFNPEAEGYLVVAGRE